MMLVGLMVTRNGGWVLGASVRALLATCDAAVVLDHASTDETPALLADLAAADSRLTVLHEPDPTWREGAYRERLRVTADGLGATHYLVLDDDELISANLTNGLRALAIAFAPSAAIALPWLTVADDLRHYEVGCWNTVAYPVLYGRAARWGTAQTFHARLPASGCWSVQTPALDGGLLHLRPAAHEASRRAWYRMIEVLSGRSAPEVEASYDRSTHASTPLTIPRHWWDDTWTAQLDLARPDWRADECRRLWQMHGAPRFDGLDLRGAGLPDLRSGSAGTEGDRP